MRHLLYLMFRYDFDVTESLKNLWEVNTAWLISQPNRLKTDVPCELEKAVLSVLVLLGCSAYIYIRSTLPFHSKSSLS